MTIYKEKALRKLKIVRGQIDGIIQMCENDRYCVDISTQILSSISQLKKANIDILNGHIRTCVKDALMSSDEKMGEEKLDEVINILDKYVK